MNTRLLLTSAAALGLTSCQSVMYNSPAGTRLEWLAPAPEHLPWWIAGGCLLAGTLGWARGSYWRGRSAEQTRRIECQLSALDEPVNDDDLKAHIQTLKHELTKAQNDAEAARQGLRLTREGQIEWLRGLVEKGDWHQWLIRDGLKKSGIVSLLTGRITDPATGAVKCPCGCGRWLAHDDDGKDFGENRETPAAEPEKTDAQFHPRGEEQARPDYAAQFLSEGYRERGPEEKIAVGDRFILAGSQSTVKSLGKSGRVPGARYFTKGPLPSESPVPPAAKPVSQSDRLPDGVWIGAPWWANWLAMDKSGCWWFYEEQPGMVQDRRWDIPSPYTTKEAQGIPEWSGDWKDSLHQRPKKG